jgi:hypothetical protein
LPKGDEWDEWHVSGDKIQRCLLDQEGLVLATETFEGDVAALVAFATTGSDLIASRRVQQFRLHQLRLLFPLPQSLR